MHKEEICYFFAYFEAFIVQTWGEDIFWGRQTLAIGREQHMVCTALSALCLQAADWRRLEERTTRPCWPIFSAMRLPFVRCTLWVAGRRMVTWDSGDLGLGRQEHGDLALGICWALEVGKADHVPRALQPSFHSWQHGGWVEWAADGSWVPWVW